MSFSGKGQIWCCFTSSPLALTLSIPPNMSKVMVFRYYWIGILCMLLGQVQILS